AATICGYARRGGGHGGRGYRGGGSGSLFARGARKKRWGRGMGWDGGVGVPVDSLYDAADEDSAPGGPDPVRGVYPMVMAATAEGITRIPDEQVAAVVEGVLADRMQNPGG